MTMEARTLEQDQATNALIDNPHRRPTRTWYKTLSYYLGSILVGFALWEVVVIVFNLPVYLLPSPSKVFVRLAAGWTSGPNLLQQSLVTAWETVLGLGLAVAVAVPLAIIMTYSRVVASLLYPALVVSQVVPKVAVAPVLVVWLGFGMLPKVVVAFLIAFFVLVVDTSVGLASVDPNMLHLARSMGASEFGVFRKVRLPHAMPNFFGGLKVAITLALVGAITGELVGSNSGLGYVVQVALGSFDMPLMFASVILMGFVGIALFAAVQVLERLAIPWSRAERLDDLASKGFG
jgi:NitT/TauT family transport system permease protein